MAPPRKARRPCQVCGRPVKETRERMKYCSTACSAQARKTGEYRKCRHCGTEMYVPRGYGNKRGFYCSTSCQLNYEYANGLRDPAETTRTANERTREIVKDGNHPLQNPENHFKAMRNLGRRNYGRTWLEERVGWALKELGMDYTSQYPVKYGKDTLGRDRYYFIDFADPKQKIGIECDGEYWHSEERDRTRRTRLEDLGWEIRRLPEAEINRDLMGTVRAATAGASCYP